MMVGHWASEHWPRTYVNVSAMDSSEELPPDRQQPPSVEMSPRHTDDGVQPTTSTTSSDVAFQPMIASESEQSCAICPELDINWIETPSFAIVCSPTTVQCSVVVQTPTLQSSASTKRNGGTGPPRRILPPTKSTRNWKSCEVTDASAASATAGAINPSCTLPRDVREWFPATGNQPALVLTSSDALASDFAKLLETETLQFSNAPFVSDFPPDVSTSAAASDASAISSATLEAAHSTLALQDVCTLGLTVGLSSSFSSEGFHAAQQKWPHPQQSNPAQLEATGFPSYLQSHPSATAAPFNVADISVFGQGALPRSTPEPVATRSDVSPSHTFHAQHIHGLHSASSSSGTEPELVTPMSSLHIGSDVPVGMIDPVEHGARSSRSSSTGTRTHPGCSTLLYRRKHNPGLHRPRTYKCNTAGQSIYVALKQYTVTQTFGLTSCTVLF